MQVFVPYPSPIAVARCLDKKRLNKQIIECYQILAAIDGKSEAWKSHPIITMYRKYRRWLSYYTMCLKRYAEGQLTSAFVWSEQADIGRPPFLRSDMICDQHKRRLYTKAPDLYPQFASYGTSDENWYVVDGKILKYINGKQV